MSRVPKPQAPALSVKQEIAIRNAQKQYNVWRSEGHPEWARDWLRYYDEILTNKNWETVPVPVNHRNDCFFKMDKETGKPMPYQRPGRYQGVSRC